MENFPAIKAGSRACHQNGKGKGLRFLALFLFCFLLSLFCLPASSRAGITGSCASVTGGLVGWWKFDDGSGTSAADSSGNGHTGTLTNGPAWTSGKINGALTFNGANTYVSVANNFGIFDNAHDFTVCAWANATSFNPDGTGNFIFHPRGERDVSLGVGGTASWCGGPHAFGFGYYDGGNNYSCATSSPSTGTRYHLCGVWNTSNATAQLYVNGIPQPAIATATPNVTTDTSAIGTQYLGAADNTWNGTIDDVRVYNRVLSASEIARIYANNSPGDMIYNQQWRTIQYCNGGAWVGTGLQQYVPNAAEFNPANATNTYDTVAAANGAASGMVTGSFWVRRIGEGAGVKQTIYSTYRTTATNIRFEISFNTGNQLEIIGRDNSTTAGVTQLDLISAATFTDYNWHQILFSVDLSNASNRSLYIDDVADASTWGTYNVGGTIAFTTTSANSSIGATPGGSNKFQGDLADLLVDIGNYTDFSVIANRRKFITSGKLPVYLGSDGSTPTGASPEVFLSGTASTWNTNKGTGGGFTTTHGTIYAGANMPGAGVGTATAVSSSPSFGGTSLIGPQRGNYLYAIGSSNTLVILNVSNPASVSIAGSVVPATGTVGGGLAFSADGNYAYLCSGDDTGLLVFNITNKASPSYITEITGTNVCANSGVYAGRVVAAVGNYLYAPSSASNTLSVFDISAPSAPVLKGQVTDATYLNSVCCITAAGNYVYAQYVNGFAVVDVSNPASPAVVGHVGTSATVIHPSFMVVDPANPNIIYNGGQGSGNFSIFDATDSCPAFTAHKSSGHVRLQRTGQGAHRRGGPPLLCAGISSQAPTGLTPRRASSFPLPILHMRDRPPPPVSLQMRDFLYSPCYEKPYHG